ncbi:MAG: hypothetical protein HYX56_05030 [Chloroflexi bacterium]|nr:hypothetical protein [Chloroflexota bacterium]
MTRLFKVPIYRCPRCRAEDISADAHPTRVIDNGRLRPVLVCRNCFRAAELELRIASDAAGLTLEPMPIRDGLKLLADHYLDRLAAIDSPDQLLEDDQRAALKAPIATALEDVRRRLAIDVAR